MKRSFVTNMPDQSGAFFRASKIIAKYGGNIVRVSYNKAVDLRTIFLDIEADKDSLSAIEEELLKMGYINNRIPEIRVIEVLIKIPDQPGAVLPVLEILDKHRINISYLNSSSGEEESQDFKMGLLIDNPVIMKTLLDEISEIYPTDIIQCDSNEENLDNTVFYIRLANEMRELLYLNRRQTVQFITESNRILQSLQEEGVNAAKVFQYIRRFAYFVHNSRGAHFKVNIETVKLTEDILLYSIQPLFGSNTYVFQTPKELIFMDTGYAIYAEEMKKVFQSIWPNFSKRPKKVYITHTDVDHCGLLSVFENADIFVNQKSVENFERQVKGLPDYREQTALSAGYNKISQIISGYLPPDPDKLIVFDKNTPLVHNDLLKIGNMPVGDVNFEIYEGSGGHLIGEMVYVCRSYGILVTGDILVNIAGFSKETAEFNALAPFLLKSVNTDSKKATEMRNKIIQMAEEISRENHKPCIICGGHGPLSKIYKGKMFAYEQRV